MVLLNRKKKKKERGRVSYHVYPLIYLIKLYEWILRWFLNTWSFTINHLFSPTVESGISSHDSSCWEWTAFLNTATQEPCCQPVRDNVSLAMYFLFLTSCVSDWLMWNRCLSPAPSPLLLWGDTAHGPRLQLLLQLQNLQPVKTEGLTVWPPSPSSLRLFFSWFLLWIHFFFKVTMRC